MNSRVLFADESTGECREITIVDPRYADVAQGRVSVLAPVGIALLGLSAGESIEWPFANGRSRRLKVVEVLYQPEAAQSWVSRSFAETASSRNNGSDLSCCK
jgi:regulator of nucleoside diphosphate kinase